VANIFGTPFSDTLNGTGADDNIYGFGGNDVIFGNGGSDILLGDDGNDNLTGGIGADQLYGQDGDDFLDGGSGLANTFLGGRGNDYYILRAAGDSVIELAGEGEDTVRAFFGGTYNLPAHIEHFQHLGLNPLIVVGNDLSNTFYFEYGRNEIYGGDGDDQIDAGIDISVLAGGRGDDFFVVRNAGDTIIEHANEGIDTILLGAFNAVNSYTLPTNIENLHLGASGSTGRSAGIGNALNNTIIGTAGYEELFGLDGNDVLHDGSLQTATRIDVPGGPVITYYFLTEEPKIADSLFGGVGNDVYFVGARGTSTIERAGEGIDEVRTTDTFYALQANVENLTFLAEFPAGLTRGGFGNELANVLRGTDGIDELFGRAGNDTLYGGTGAANALFGQEGDDIYAVDAVGDSVIEFAGDGNDTVRASVSSFTLRDHVENLIYTGTGDFIGVGSDATDNMIQGGVGLDQLNGMGGNDMLIGGSGADLLQGGAGADQFRYLGGEAGFDRIIDFVSGQDKIALANSGFAHTATIDFVSTNTPAPTSANSTFLYNSNSGMLSYDPDGTGAAAAIQIAQLNAGQTLVAGDLIFF
jgi:Ca2+-binding RTX toxin-like protein